MKYFKLARVVPILLCAGTITACSSSSNDNGTGTVSISLMDRPVDGIAELYVTISEVWIKPAGDGPAFELPLTSTPMPVNLLELTDQNAAVLVEEAVVDPGRYNWIELRIEDSEIGQSYAVTDVGGTEMVDIDVPSGKIRLVSGFDVGENQAVRLLFDWDVRKGLTNPVGRDGYLLRPAFRVLDVDEYGAVSGTISLATLNGEASCSAAGEGDRVIYVYEGDVTPDQIGGSPAPLTTVEATPSSGVDGEYEYRTILMPGPYTLAFTCKGTADRELDDDAITLLPPTGGNPITVTGADLTGIDF